MAEWPTDLVDLLESRLHPGSAVLATSRPIPRVVAHQAFDRRLLVHGLEPRHVDAFVRRFFRCPSAKNGDVLDRLPFHPNDLNVHRSTLLIEGARFFFVRASLSISQALAVR